MPERSEQSKRFLTAWESWYNLLSQAQPHLKSTGSILHAELDNGEKILRVARDLAIAEVFGSE